MWERTDAWILQAVVYAGRRGNVRRVIARADWINHDIASRQELEQSVRRLEAAGLVSAEGLRIRPTRAGRRVVRRSGGWRAAVHAIAPRVETTLRERVPFPERDGGWTLTQQDWQAAYDAYWRAATAGR